MQSLGGSGPELDCTGLILSSTPSSFNPRPTNQTKPTNPPPAPFRPPPPPHTHTKHTADGDENWHLFKVTVTDEHPTARDLTPFEGVRAQNVMTSKRRPDELLVRAGERAGVRVG
jgi:hypothetical protein